MKKKEELQLFADYYRDFIEEGLKCGSEHTVKNYKVSMGLYLEFLENNCSVNKKNFSVNHFNTANIRKYLDWLEDHRNCTAQSCNVRLSSLRAFLKYVVSRDIVYTWLYVQSCSIRLRKISILKS
jgi:site-specific recombinase XerD